MELAVILRKAGERCILLSTNIPFAIPNLFLPSLPGRDAPLQKKAGQPCDIERIGDLS